MAPLRLSILTVDNDPSVTLAVTLALESPARKVAAAANVDDALVQVHDHAFDVVIIDNKMPRRSGLELTRQLRQDDFHGEIIVLAAAVTEEIRLAYGAFAVETLLDKPFDLSELRRMVDRVAEAA